MRSRRSRILLGTALALTLAIPTIGRADDKDNKTATFVVHFGQPQPQGSPAATTHFLLPDDITIRKGDSVTFVVNGGGHGIAIHRVNEETTRADIAADLCQGPMGSAESDRAARAAVCNGTAVTPTTINGTPVVVIGTQNLDYTIDDAKEDVIIHTGFNVSIPATPTSPAIVIANPRVDDTANSERLLGTSGKVVGDSAPASDNPAGAFLTGTAPPVAPATAFTPGQRIRVQFLKTGRYLVICMNRAHSLNDHMFGFVTVSDDDDDQ